MKSTLIALLLLCSHSTTAAETLLLSPEVSVSGTSQSEWSRKWWQWAASFEHQRSPIADQTGSFCASKQNGDVWFLAGTYGTKRTIRTCTVPTGKYLFFPLINYVVTPSSVGSTDCNSVMSTAARMTDQVSNLLLEVDGVRYGDLERHRQSTRSCFDIGVLAEPKIRIYPSAANGYYVMLKPLPPGTHTLNFGGVLPSMVQAVTYTIIVEQRI